MNVQHTLHLGGGHSIEIGTATWDPTDTSIRDRWPTVNGGFSPHSSSEVPKDSMIRMIVFGAQHDLWSAAECAEMIAALAASIARQHP